MKRISILVAIALLVGIPFAAGADAYEKEVVVANMRANVARIGTIKAAVAEGNFLAAAHSFYEYGSEAALLHEMDPPKGSKEEWRKIWADFQDTAFKGVGACGERDGPKALKLLDELVALNKVGHPTFR